MAPIAVFDPLYPHGEFASIELLLAYWDNLSRAGTGQWYVYAFRDADGSVFYVGKGTGNRAHDTKGHRHGRLGYYLAEFLNNQYSVEILRSGLPDDEAELLEALLLENLGSQLVNWADNFGALPQTVTVAQAREAGQALRDRARAVAAAARLDEAVSICREGLSYFSNWETTDHEAELGQLRQLALKALAARVDPRQAERDYVPHAPGAACEILSDLTKYLCAADRAEEALREVNTFTERYPRGSFCDYEVYDHRYGRTIKTSINEARTSHVE